MKTFTLRAVGHVDTLAQKLRASVLAGHALTVTVERTRKRRTTDQNARMWALLTEISREAPAHMDGVWYAPEVWHEYFKARFLGVEPGPFGTSAPRSTAKLSTVEMSGYCDQIDAWAAQEGIILSGGPGV